MHLRPSTITIGTVLGIAAATAVLWVGHSFFVQTPVELIDNGPEITAPEIIAKADPVEQRVEESSQNENSAPATDNNEKSAIIESGTNRTPRPVESFDMPERCKADIPVIEHFVVPDFTAQLLSGGTVKLSELYRDHPVILYFWASNCPTCAHAMPILSDVYKKAQGRYEVLGVNILNLHGDTPERAQRFVTNKSIAFPTALDETGKISNDYNVQFTSTHVMIARRGKVYDIRIGTLTEEVIETFLECSKHL